MPAPQPHDSSRTDEVRAAAAHLFQSAGYSATTMSDIAAAVGILPGSLYHHFASKEEIAVELIEAFNESLIALADDARRQQSPLVGSPEAVLRRLSATATTLSTQHGAAVRLRAYEAPTVSTKRLRSAMTFTHPPLGTAWGEALEAIAADAGVRIRYPDLLNYALLTTTLSSSFANHPIDTPPELLAEQICELLFHGIASDCPDDHQLDHSAATQAAREAIAEWKQADIDIETASDSRVAIIRAARTQFARHGYSSTTIRDIAQVAGVRMGTLYRRIESKEAVLQEIIGTYSALLDRAVRAVLTAGSTPVEALDAILALFIHASRRFREESEIVKVGWSSRESGSNPFHDYYQQTQKRLRLWEDTFERGQRDDSMRSFATPQQLAIHTRTLAWIPFQDMAHTGESRAHQFLRDSLLRGAFTPPESEPRS